MFLWQPGDGSDFFDGGREDDAVVFGNITNVDGLPTLDPDTGLPEINVSGVGGFCAPVFDAQGRLALGLVVLGSVATLDTDWNGAPAQALRRCARQLSADLGHQPTP